MLPHERANSNQDELEEERRLFFVGDDAGQDQSVRQLRPVPDVPGPVAPDDPLAVPLRARVRASCTSARATTNDPQPQAGRSRLPGPRRSRRRPSRPAPYAPGELVRHKTFGLGRVKKFVDMGANSVITISFNSGQTKSLLLQYAELTKM